jgi:hypothetical protein
MQAGRRDDDCGGDTASSYSVMIMKRRSIGDLECTKIE